jgi:hypothetical protein
MKSVSDILVGKIKTNIFYSKTFFPQIVPRMDNVKKYGRADQATDGNMIRRTRITFWVSKATNAHSKYEILLAFPQETGCAKSSQYYIVHTLLVLFSSLAMNVTAQNVSSPPHLVVLPSTQENL